MNVYIYVFLSVQNDLFFSLLLFTYTKIYLTFVYAYPYKLSMNPINTYRKLVFRYDTDDFN